MAIKSGRTADSLRGRRVLVTGATGFLGANLLLRLLASGAEVTLLARTPQASARLDGLLRTLARGGYPRPTIIPGDLLDSSVVHAAVGSRPQVVFHLAAAGVNPAAETRAVLQTNILGTWNLLEACKRLDLQRFVYSGSCSEYGSGRDLSEEMLPAPTTAYGASKASAGILVRTYAQTFGLPAVHLRPFMAYGPLERRGRLVPNTILSGLAGCEIRMTAGEQERDFVYVDDVVEGFLLAAVCPAEDCVGQVINLSSGQGTKIREVVSLILEIISCPVRPQFGALPYREGETWQQSGANRRARELLGWSPRTSLPEGLERTVNWIMENRELAQSLEQ